MIQFTDVVLHYPGASHAAIDGVSLSVAPAIVTALVGPNGSGKSTLIRALLGRLSPSRGTISIEGQPLTALSRRAVAQRVAIVPQREEPVFPLSVREFIGLGRFAHMGLWQGETAADRDAVQEAAKRVGAEIYLERRTDQLSGGEWQRVRLARALAQGARTLVLDEPTAFLDVAHEMAMFELLDALARAGHAVLLVSHELNLVARFAGHMALLHRGRLVSEGTPDTVMRGDALERVYEWPLVVSRDPAVGAPMLVPLRGRAPR